MGDTLCDFRLQDQFGDEVSLWQFWGDVVLVDISTIWCGPCQELAASTQATFEHFEDDGFMYLTIIQQDVEGNPPKQVDVVEWAEAFGIEAPVLGDGDEVVAAVRQNQFPALLLLDRKMKVHERVTPPDAGVVDAAIEDLLK